MDSEDPGGGSGEGIHGEVNCLSLGVGEAKSGERERLIGSLSFTKFEDVEVSEISQSGLRTVCLGQHRQV